MKNLSEKELLALYIKYTKYRDTECCGMAKISIAEFLKGVKK